MLTLTDNATSAIRTLVAQPEAPEGAGLRIANDPGAGGLTLAVTQAPQDGDQVIDESGVRVFVEEQAAQLLDDKALDAAVDDGGRLQFAVAPQAGAGTVDGSVG